MNLDTGSDFDKKAYAEYSDYREILSRLGFTRRFHLDHVDKVNWKVRINVPFSHYLPYYYKKLLALLGINLLKGAYFVPHFDVKKNNDCFLVEQAGTIWAGKYHPAYPHSHDKYYALKKLKELEIIISEVVKRLYSFRRDDYHFDKETVKLEPRWEGLMLLRQKKVYLNRFLFTLPREFNDFLYWLFFEHAEVYYQLLDALKESLIRTMYRIMWYQLQRDTRGEICGDFVYSKFRKHFVASFLLNVHVTHSFTFKGLSEEELIELISTGRIDGRTGKSSNSTVFDPHLHFHVLMPNFLYWKPEGLFIRVDYYHNNQIIRSYWKSNVLRVFKKYREYLDTFDNKLYDIMLSKQYVAGTDKAWLFVPNNYSDIFHFIKYSHRPPVLDVIRYFEVHNTRVDFEKIISSYPAEWLRYVVTYINRTFPYGIFSNPRRYGIELDNIKSGDLEGLSSKIEMKEPSHDESGAVVYESVPFFKVAKEVLANVDEILVIDKFGNTERYWEYKK